MQMRTRDPDHRGPGLEPEHLPAAPGAAGHVPGAKEHHRTVRKPPHLWKISEGITKRRTCVSCRRETGYTKVKIIVGTETLNQELDCYFV